MNHEFDTHFHYAISAFEGDTFGSVFSRPGAGTRTRHGSASPPMNLTDDTFLGLGGRRPLDSVQICVLSGNANKNSPTEWTGYPEPPFEKS